MFNSWQTRIRCLSGDYKWKPFRFIIDGDPSEFNAITMVFNGVNKFGYLHVGWTTGFTWEGYHGWTSVQLCLYHESKDIVYYPKKMKGVSVTIKQILTRFVLSSMRYLKDILFFDLILETVGFIKSLISQTRVNSSRPLPAVTLTVGSIIDELKAFSALDEEMKLESYAIENENKVSEYIDNNKHVRRGQKLKGK